MTRQEAIEVLHHIIAFESGFAEAKQMAIEALEKEPSEDCISRATLIKRWDEMSVRGRTEFDQEIMVAPSVVPISGNKCHRHGIRLEDGTPIYECIGCDKQDC